MKDGAPMINFAHRGASGDYPENTLLAFSQAIALGATAIELDVHKSKDNYLVVIHDEDIERTFKGQGKVCDFTLQELQSFKCRRVLFEELTSCRVPTLDSVLSVVASYPVLINIELKTNVIQYPDIEQDVITLVSAYKLEKRVLISSFHAPSILKCKELDPTLKTGFICGKKRDDLIEVSKSLNVDAIHPNVKFVTEALVQQLHEAGFQVNVYGVNAPKKMRKLIEWDVDGIFTDVPALLHEILTEQNLKIIEE